MGSQRRRRKVKCWRWLAAAETKEDPANAALNSVEFMCCFAGCATVATLEQALVSVGGPVKGWNHIVIEALERSPLQLALVKEFLFHILVSCSARLACFF